MAGHTVSVSAGRRWGLARWRLLPKPTLGVPNVLQGFSRKGKHDRKRYASRTCHAALLRRSSGHRLCVRQALQLVVRGVLPRRPRPGTVAHGPVGRSVGYVGVAPHGPARRGLLHRRVGCHVDGHRPGHRHLSELEVRGQTPAQVLREGRQRHHGARLLLQPLPRHEAHPHDHRRGHHPFVLHHLHRLLLRHRGQAVRDAVRLGLRRDDDQTKGGRGHGGRRHHRVPLHVHGRLSLGVHHRSRAGHAHVSGPGHGVYRLRHRCGRR